MIGGKTGYTKTSGRTLVTAAQRNGTVLICVTINASGDWQDHTYLFDRGFETVETKVFEKCSVLSSLPIAAGKETCVPIVTDREVRITVPIGKEITVSYKIEQIKDGGGVKVNNENKYQANTNCATEAGEYLVTAMFDIRDAEIARNYTTNPHEKVVTLIIRRVAYDLEIENTYLESQWEDFVEDKTYEFYFEYELPEGVTPYFTLFNVNGERMQEGVMEKMEEVEGGETPTKTTYKYSFSVEEAGEYTCVITFVHDNKNYETITLELNSKIYIGVAV
jgi:hypothetical protein